MIGTATYGERVVIIEVNSGRVNLQTGCIASTEFSHVHADNRSRTIVRADRKSGPARKCPAVLLESAEDDGERGFPVDSIHLLREKEARALGTLNATQAWFGAIYEEPQVTAIHRALKRLTRRSNS
jgi:hypothetical protein